MLCGRAGAVGSAVFPFSSADNASEDCGWNDGSESYCHNVPKLTLLPVLLLLLMLC